MKKYTKCTIAALGVAMLMTGCGHASEAAWPTVTPPAQSADEAVAVLGGYNVNAGLVGVALPGEAQAAFNKAMDAIEGATYDPIALLGTQVVSGTNYALLCRVTPIVTDGTSELAVVTVYEDLDGNAEILSAAPFDLATVAGTNNALTTDDEMVGGFETNTEFTAQSEDEDTAKIFDTAEAEAAKSGDIYSFAAELGWQAVNGENHAFLVLKDGDDSKQARWAVLTAYEGLDGNVSLLSVYELDPGAYASHGEAVEGTYGADTDTTAEPTASASAEAD